MWLIPQKETTTSPDHWEWFKERYTQRMQNVLFAEAVRILGSRDDAQDVMQEAMLRGVTYCWQLRDEEKLFQWMFTIVRNLCFDMKRQRFRAKMCTLQLKTGLVQTTVSLEDRAISQENEAAIKAYLKQLKSPEKEIVHLRMSTDKTLKEIAEELGLNYHTTRFKYNRLMKKIMKIVR